MESLGQIEIKGFRRLASVKVDALRPLNVIIGANGVGKTTFLDALNLLSASASGKLGEQIRHFQGLDCILTIGGSGNLLLEVTQAPSHNRYALGLNERGQGYQISYEQMRDGTGTPWLENDSSSIRYRNERGEQVEPTWKLNNFETALSQAPRDYNDIAEFRQFLASLRSYRLFDTGERSPVRLPQPLYPTTDPGVNGECLISSLYNLRETERDRFEFIEDTLRVAFPGFERLEFPVVAAGTQAIAWRDKRFGQPLYAHQLSEGKLRFLWLVTLLQDPSIPALTLIDEPEVSLHPELLSLLADLLREASYRTQLFVATQSNRLVCFLKPSEVLVLNGEEDGVVKPTWADEMDLERWLDEYTLDDLWSMGLMGGRA